MAEATRTLDRALLGAARSITVALPRFGGVSVVVRALLPTEVGLALDSDIGNATAGAAMRHRILAIVCSTETGPAFDGPEDVAGFPSDVVAALWSAYQRVHTDVYEANDRLVADMDARLRRPGAWLERARARHAAGLVAFYGLDRALDATVAQVLWFAKLMEKEKR